MVPFLTLSGLRMSKPTLLTSSEHIRQKHMGFAKDSNKTGRTSGKHTFSQITPMLPGDRQHMTTKVPGGTGVDSQKPSMGHHWDKTTTVASMVESKATFVRL